MNKRFFRCGSRLLLLAAVLFVGTRCVTDNTSDTPGPTSGSGSTAGSDRELKEWMVDYMKEIYLWNEAMADVTPDYTLSYDAFLTKILEDIAAQGDINHDDGHWENGVRQYFYSNIQRYEKNDATTASVTRSTREMTEGTGITNVYVSLLMQRCIFILGGVSPSSPAGQAGLKRGDVIVEVDGEPIGATETQYNEAFNRIVYPSGQVTVSVLDASGSSSTEITYCSASYEDNPVWKYDVIPAGDAKVGYLCYDSFNRYYDDELLEVFDLFKAQGVDELLLDLRYNGGGYVVSSTMLATFVAGTAHKGEIYMRPIYNAERMASSSQSEAYRIGIAGSGDDAYDKIAVALDFSLGLERVYVLCSGSTASASELLINGLRGLGIEVRLIGARTNGKNVGMEGLTKTFGEYEYDFSPITFYSENAEGFSDYGDGFIPDVEAVEGALPIADWGDPEDGLLALALEWIETGVQPAARTRSSTATAPRRTGLSVPHKSLEGTIICRELSDK